MRNFLYAISQLILSALTKFLEGITNTLVYLYVHTCIGGRYFMTFIYFYVHPCIGGRYFMTPLNVLSALAEFKQAGRSPAMVG